MVLLSNPLIELQTPAITDQCVGSESGIGHSQMDQLVLDAVKPAALNTYVVRVRSILDNSIALVLYEKMKSMKRMHV